MSKFVAFLGIGMSVFFVIMGVVIPLYPPSMLSHLPSWQLTLIGFILIMYGIFRFTRAYKLLKKQNQ